MHGDELEHFLKELRELVQVLQGAEKIDKDSLLLALDQGGHASRALVFDAQGRQIAQAFSAISTVTPDADRVEHDPNEVIASLRAAIDDVAQTLGDDCNRLAAAGLATQRSSIVCWDRISGAPLSPVLSWQDRRNNRLVESLRSEAARIQAIQAISGLVLSPHYGASKLRWCLDEIPAVADAFETQRLTAGPLASFILYSLLDEHPHCIDPSNASRTQLWSTRERDWSPELLQLFGVPRNVLPACVPTHHRYGTLQVGAKRIPLTVCTGDQAAVPFATGAVRNDTVYFNVGTGGFLLAPGDDDIADAAPYLRSVLWSDEHRTRYALEGTINGAGSALDWLSGEIGVDAHRAARSLTVEQLHSQEPPIFLNGISGVGSPFWIPSLESRFVGSGDETARVAAVLESIAFLAAANLEGLRRLKPTIRKIAAGGGLAESTYLCRCVADLSGLGVSRSSEREFTAKGLAFLVAGEPDDWRSEAALPAIEPKHDPALKTRYARWLELMR